ncbi:endonuclease/exonuclease/phosphatase family protein [Prevotella sp. OH937_COT-195]|uniref:endonuclease/exonuclease/phosphatase family protein n=1 Tax=Prevotella sp. OH937_COT-195 TaxID=2491051 RepID=UPI0013151C08|nr:endonuclease/exonuclease/phosphatase family protein [Prevotella sp. OH937_COT-195]
MLKKVKTILTRIVGGANIATILAAVFTGYSGYWDAEAHPSLSCLGLVFPIFALINVGFLLFWTFFRWRGIIIPLLGFAVCFFPIRDYCPVNLPSKPPADAIQVLSMNVMYFNFKVPKDSVDALHTLLRYLKRTKPDIACFQEIPIQKNKWEMLKETGRHFEKISNDKGKTLVAVSRFPIIGKELIPYESEGNLSAAFHLLIEKDTVTLVANHLQSFSLSEKERSEVEKIIGGSGNRNPRSKENIHLTEKLVRATRHRASQVKAVCHYTDSIMAGGRSVILCGDFNETPVSYSHREMKKRLTDCYSSTATGPGFSYEQNGMHLRIDHIFCSSDWTPYRCQVIDGLHASDHYPLRCWLKKSTKR